MSKAATQHAIDKLRTFLGDESDYNTIVLGSLHGIAFKYDTIMDWTGRGEGLNVNFNFDKINAGKWNLVFNACCEHMYPMSEVQLPGYYVLQSNDRYGDTHINRCLDIRSFVDQLELKDIIYQDSIELDGVQYFTVIGEKW